MSPIQSYFAKIFLIVISIVTILLFFYLVIPSILNQHSEITVFGSNLPVTNPDKFVVALKIDEKNNDNKITVELLSLLIPKKSQLAKNSNCINRVIVSSIKVAQVQVGSSLWNMETRIHVPDGSIIHFNLNNTPEITTFFYEGFDSSSLNICGDYGPRQESNYNLKTYYQLKNIDGSDPSFTTAPTEIIPLFFYPFDRYKIQLNILLMNQNEEVASDVIGEIHSLTWDINANISQTNSSKANTVEILYSRPLRIQFMVFILLLSLLLIIIFSTFIKDSTTYLGGLLGILLGIEGLRPIMKPSEIMETTMIDALLLSFYILIGLTFFMRFVIFPVWSMTHQDRVKRTPSKLKIRKKNPNGTG